MWKGSAGRVVECPKLAPLVVDHLQVTILGAAKITTNLSQTWSFPTLLFYPV